MTRVILTVLALVVATWFAVSALAIRDSNRAAATLSRGARLDARTAARVAGLLRGAGRLNPDREVSLLRARLALEQGDNARAEQILAGVTAAEPQNVAAWALVAQAASDPATLKRAYTHIEALVPGVPAPK